MTDKPKNDNRSSIHRNVLIGSIGMNAILIIMLILLYIVTMTPSTPISPSGTPGPFQLSATALIATATERGKLELGIPTTPTATSDPALAYSPEREAALRERLLNALETELGFLPPILEDKVNRLTLLIWLHNPQYALSYEENPASIIYDIDRITIEGYDYIAITLGDSPGWDVGSDGFIFRYDGHTAELLARVVERAEIEPFDDRNGNGFPDVALRYAGETYGEMRVNAGIRFYEIRPNNEFIDLTAGLNASINSFVDLDDDGIMELYGTQRLFIPESVLENSKYPPEVPRWFFWNGEVYEPYPVVVEE